MALIKDIATDALRHWERRRLIYNGVLAAVVVGDFVVLLPRSYNALDAGTFTNLFMLAVAANLLYCAAYIPDVFIQFSGYRDIWRQWRWVLFAVGILLAVSLTMPIALVLLGGSLTGD